MTNRIAYTKPSITELEVEYATDAARTGWGAKCYDYIHRFEAGFRAFVGSEHAIATSSCTGAMHMGLHALGVGPGDEVILADINWIATAAPIVHVGATPVFVDVDPESWCIDSNAAEAAITARTKAIVATHIYGNLCDLDRLQDICRRHNLFLIEDAAEGIGSYWRGRHVGSIGTFGTFSFHGTKTMTTGEGGMFVTDDPALHETVLTLSNHGRRRGQTKQFWADVVGFKYKMSNIQAAIGVAQLERVEELIAGKRRIFEAYAKRLKGLPLRMNPERKGTRNGFWMPTIVADEETIFDREALLEDFTANEIDGRVFFWPLSMLPMFKERPENTVSYGLFKRAVNLPTYQDLTEAEIDRVSDLVRSAFTSAANGVQRGI